MTEKSETVERNLRVLRRRVLDVTRRREIARARGDEDAVAYLDERATELRLRILKAEVSR